MDKLVWVLLGGALGSGARYLVALGFASRAQATFPWSTFLVNVVGSFVIGAFAFAAPGSSAASPTVRAFWTIGVLGGFTTYSSFNQETLNFVQAGQIGSAASYWAATSVTCLIAGFGGMAVGRWIAAT